VGIGTSSPGDKLHIAEETANETTTSDVIRIESTSSGTTGVGFGGAIYFLGARAGDGALQAMGRIQSLAEVNSGTTLSSGLAFLTATAGSPSEKVRISNVGRVGIGIAAPIEKLQVVGQLISTGSNSTAATTGAERAIMDLSGYSATDHSARFGHFRGATAAGAGQVRLYTDSVERVRIDASGNVGIGTTTPAYALDVRSAGATTLQVKSASNSDDTQLKLQSNAFFFNITNEGASGNITYVSDDAQDQIWYTDNASNASAERFRIEGGADVDAVYFSNSNVGIGTSAPAAELHVKGPSGDTTVIVDGPTTGDAASISFKSNGTQTAFVAGGTSGSKRLYMGCDSGKAMWLDATGLGIGTTSPGNELDVIGTTTVRYSSTTFSTKRMDIQAANTSNLIQSVTNPLHIYDNSAIRICMLQGGNVGIGTSAPSHTLEVNGSFAATTKSFLIDHPTKENMRLRYGALEGPENGVYIRGKSTYKIIDLPDYWTHLVDEESITVQLTPIGHHQNLYIEKIRNNQVFINTDRLKEKLNYYYIVHAERKDVSKLEVEIEKIENE
jgi:hypothetical protein